MRMMMVVVLASGALFIAGCSSGGGDDSAHSPFWDPATPPPGISARFLDPMPPLEKMVEESDAIVIAEVTGVVDRKQVELNLDLPNATIDPAIEDSVRQRLEYISQSTDFTTFSVEVQSWIKSDADEGNVLVRQFGGVMPDGYFRMMDGDALLEKGRTYVLFLRKDGNGLYERLWFGRGIYDLTSGEVEVLTHPLHRDLEFLEGMTGEEIADYLKGLKGSFGAAT